MPSVRRDSIIEPNTKTSAEIYVDNPPEEAKSVKKATASKSGGDGISIGGSAKSANDRVGINLIDANSILRSKATEEKKEPDIRVKDADGGTVCSIFPCIRCGLPSQHRGIMKGTKRSIAKKQHIIHHWRKLLDNRISQKKFAIIVDGNPDLNISYRELDEFSNSIAYNLKQLKFSGEFENLNPNRELVIGVCHPACYEYVVILLAILKLGAAILPISTDLPAERIAEIIKLTKPVLMIASPPEEDDVFEDVQSMVDVDVIYVDEIWSMLVKREEFDKAVMPFKDPIQSPDPKKPYPPMWKRTVALAVAPSETEEIQALSYDSRAFMNRIKWEDHFFVYFTSEYVLLPPCFDTVDSISEVMAAMVIGVTLIAYQSSTDICIPEQLFSYCQTCKIRRLTLWPNLLKACTTAMQLFDFYVEQVKTVRFWFCVGGVLRSELAETFFELLPIGAQLIHMYQLEDCAGALSFQTYETLVNMKEKSFYARLPVGFPVPNMNIYVLDPDMKPVIGEEMGEIYVSGVQLPRVTNLEEMGPMYFRNPFTTNKDHKFLVKTMDFGRIKVKSNGQRTLIHEMARAGHYYIDNQIVWLQNIEMYIKRLTHLVKRTHCLCYRPFEDDQLIIAFCVTTGSKITYSAIEEELRHSLPLNMIPEIVIVKEIPRFEETGYPDENSLLKTYQERRRKRQVFENWGELHIDDQFVLRAAKILCFVLCMFLGVPIKFVVENCWNSSYLHIRRTTVIKATFIVKELHRNRYPIYIDDFIYCETLQNIAEGMVEARRQRGYCNRVNCPADEVVFLKNRYKLEIMARSSRTSVCSLLARCFSQRGQLDYYAEVGFGAMRKYFDTTWPIYVAKKLSITIRRKKERNKLVGAVLNINWHDEFHLKSNVVSKEIGYKLELIRYLEAGMTYLIHDFYIDSHFHQDKTHVIQVCYIALDSKALSDTEIHGLTDKIIRSLLAFGKVKGFEAIVLITYDFFCLDICLNSYGFNVAREIQVNQFVASDGMRPYALAPDTMVATICWKLFSKVQEENAHRPIRTARKSKKGHKKPWADKT